jgi:sarcosine oxidase subunit beta
MTPDGSPIVGWAKETGGFLLSVGLCGQGFMLGPGLGEMLTRLVCHQETPQDLKILEFFSPYRKFASTEKLK